DACRHQDEEIEEAMLRAKRHLQRGNPEPRRRTPHQKTKETDWEKVVSDVLIGILQKEAANW
ncbi:MAG: hypothetical protein IIZ16_05300, partial [Selenomonas sp.]|nr:hypothetical protein [Selenomonas sp.]